MEINRVLATEFNFPNISIYRRMNGDTQIGYEMIADEGYVFYDITANNTEPNPENPDEENPVTYYYTIGFLPNNFNFDNFPYVAVPRDSVDENYIFGGGGDNPEVM